MAILKTGIPCDIVIIGSADLQFFQKSIIADYFRFEKILVPKIIISQERFLVYFHDGSSIKIPGPAEEFHPGGGAINIGSTLAALNSSVHIVFPLGNDENGEIIRQHLGYLNIQYTTLPRGQTATTVTISSGGRSCSLMCKPDYILDGEMILPSSAKVVVGASISKFEIPLIEEAFNAYPDAMKFLTPATREIGSLRVDNNYKKLLRTPDCIQLNDKEAKLATGSDDLNTATEEMLSWGIKNVIVTCNKYGSIIKGALGNFKSSAWQKGVRVIDPVGCGDAHAAGFIHHFLVSQDIKQAIAFANFCGAKNLSVKGASIFPKPYEWEGELGPDWAVEKIEVTKL